MEKEKIKTLEEIIEILKKYKRQLKEQYKVKKIAIFGSYVRNAQKSESDIDIMVEFSEPVGFEFFRLAIFLEDILGTKVDLVTPDAVKPNRQKYIVRELTYV